MSKDKVSRLVEQISTFEFIEDSVFRPFSQANSSSFRSPAKCSSIAQKQRIVKERQAQNAVIILIILGNTRRKSFMVS